MLYENIIEYIKKYTNLIIETINNPSIVVNFEELETGFTTVRKQQTPPKLYKIIRLKNLDDFYMLKENLNEIREIYNTKFNTETNRWRTKHGKAPTIDKSMYEREENEIANVLENGEEIISLIEYYRNVIVNECQNIAYSNEVCISFKSIRVSTSTSQDKILLPNGVVHNEVDKDTISKVVYLYIDLLSRIKSVLNLLKYTHSVYSTEGSLHKKLTDLNHIYYSVGDIIASLYNYVNSVINVNKAIELDNIRKYIKIDEDLSKQLKSKYTGKDIENANRNNKHRNVWIKDAITELILEPNDEMIDKVYEHCKHIPSFEVLYLRRTKLTYLSDGKLTTTPDAINHHVQIYRVPSLNDWFLEGTPEASREDAVKEDRPCIYLGETWCLYFTAFGQDILRECRVYFATPEQYIDAYKDTRPDLLEGFVPFSDLMVITNDWCSRNNPRLTYNKGIDLYTPWGQRQSLSSWILGPCISKGTIRFNKQEVSNVNGFHARAGLLEWQKLQDSLVAHSV